MILEIKFDLQKTIKMWSIHNNVEYKKVPLIKSKLLILSTHHEEFTQPYYWHLQVIKVRV